MNQLFRTTAGRFDTQRCGELDGTVYDVADHLRGVTQGSQARSFVYDSVGRLISAVNPETGGAAGAVGYQYDINGNLKEKDTYHGNATIYTYDALNRVTSKTFSGPLAGVTPGVTYCCDGITGGAGCSGAPTGSYMKGRLTMVENSNSATLYTAYDALGRVTASNQQTAGMTAPYPALSYTYDLAGEMTLMGYPSGRQVTYGYDPAGRVSQVQGMVQAATTTYASNISYAPQAAIEAMQLGNGLWETTNFNSRQQATGISLGTAQTGTSASSVWGLTNAYGDSGQNNGNITQQTISAPGMTTITEAYTYDGVNRLLVAAENPASAANPVCPDAASQWCAQFGYDVYGNRSVAAGRNFAFVNQPVTFNASNQITGTGWSYDTVNLRGTITGDPGADASTYDAEDRLVTANGVSYRYDGDGRRVAKVPVAGVSGTTWYVYGAAGQLAAEYNGPVSEAGTAYLTADQVGSTDERHDFYPFGEEILTGSPFSR